MTYHTIAFTENVSASSFTGVAAVQDTILNTVNNRILPGRDYGLIFTYVLGSQVDQARLDSPQARAVILPHFAKIDQAATPTSDPNFNDYNVNPFRIRALEEFQPQVVNQGMAEQDYVIMGLRESFEPIPSGEIWTMRGTSTTSTTANEWSTITTTWSDELPAGKWALVGGVVQSTTAIAFRWVIEGQDLRPGGVAVTALGNRTSDVFYQGRLGVLGRFSAWNPPRVQMLESSASSDIDVLMSFMRLPG
jgi:hypothetical protein